MVILRRAPIRRNVLVPENALNVTVKSAIGLGRVFAPSWRMVMDHKNKKMTDEEYRTLYLDILRGVSTTQWEQLHEYGIGGGGGIITLMCYCPDGTFCHTYQMIDFAVRHYGALFVSGL